MPIRTLVAIFFIATNALWTLAAAQNVYKCGDSYSHQPCAGGTLVQSGDARSQAQKSQADAATVRDARAAAAMERERLKQEGQAAPATGLGSRPDSVAADRRPVITKPAKPEIFRAVAPGSGKKAMKKKKKKLDAQ